MLAILAAATASLKAVLVKLAYVDPHVDAITLIFLRMMLALPFFLWLWARSAPQVLSSRQWFGVLLVGFTGYYFSSFCDFVGLQYISAGLERLVLFTYPTVVLLLQALLHKRWPDKFAWGSVALCYLGLLAAMGGDLQQDNAAREVLIGSTWVFVGGVSMAVYFLISANMIATLGANRLTGMGCAAATLLVAVHFFSTHALADLSLLSWSTWCYAAAMAVICTMLPSWLISLAIARIGASQTATIGNLGPVLTLLLAWIVLSEPFSWLQLLGLALVLLGIHILDRSKTDAIKKGD